jgi:hypothetical protein
MQKEMYAEQRCYIKEKRRRGKNKMDRQTYEQLDRIEFFLQKIAEKTCPEIFKEEGGKK